VSGPSLYLALILNVLLEHQEGCATDCEEAVRATPKNRFPVVFLDVVGKLLPDQARSDRFEIIDQTGWLGLRIERHQKVDVISFAIKCEELTIPRSEKSRKVVFKP
jgi:hypothetical protein